VDPSELNNEAQNPVYASELEKLRELERLLASCSGQNCWNLH
jgi:hypothetical protein